MRVADAMLPEPVTVTADTTFETLLDRLAGSRQATAAVLDADRRVLGLVGVHDILRKFVPHYLELDSKLMEVMHDGYFEEHIDRLRGTRVRDFMSTEIDSVAPDDVLIKVVALIVRRRRKVLPVIDAGGRFVGMITRRTILDLIIARWSDQRS